MTWQKEWVDREIPVDEWPEVHSDGVHVVRDLTRVTACNNRPGLKQLLVRVLDAKDEPVRGVKVRFDTHPSEGVAFDHPNVWNYTDERGYIIWNHLGKPTRYRVFFEEAEDPLIENIRTDLGNEYCKPPHGPSWAGNVPINRPGVYSYKIEVQRKGEGES